MVISAALMAIAVTLQSPADSGGVLYQSWCSNCHGADGRGQAKSMVKTEVPPTDLANCATSTAEPDERWIAIVRDGGASVGLSIDMPAFGEGATPEQIRAVVKYIRSLCREPGWPPGELNLPRPFLAEKAYPENEVVVTAHGRGQELIYERRIGRRFQVEGAARTLADSAGGFDGVTAAFKYNVWHSLAPRALASVGLEVTPPLGLRDAWELEPFLAYGFNPGGSGTVFQGEFIAPWEDPEGFTAAEMRLGVGQQVGRVVPMLEAGWTIPRRGQQTLSLFPQLWVQLSRLGHVAASAGLELPVAGPDPKRGRLVAFVLWDYGDAPLLRGW